ncbi:hypothetical protein SAMN05421805_105331 [Saccharopolyspora antimicrobica]|uniref:Uncharacterized protein n=1 Tax=Saccharopolyspora antimicrobica TaxID=455193 RepID=A0A1I5ACB2_9PSEU|nr:hypothetical protein [Saccharopolyspora antimicrobica]RKT83191.1 hypothetical protein ATL45_1464 [Saccharopolyspora antimicrobica]SFN60105.1 hypothetical protein SAMN05421805_105331 [Saccharopolyspora antimicrobica]
MLRKLPETLRKPPGGADRSKDSNCSTEVGARVSPPGGGARANHCLSSPRVAIRITGTPGSHLAAEITNCADAVGERCECGHCTGTEHGWVGKIRVARRGTPEDLRKLEQDADQRWREECAKQEAKKQKKPKATLPHKRAAIDTACSDLVKELHQEERRAERSRISNAGSTGKYTARQGSPVLDKASRRANPEEGARSSAEGTDDPEPTPEVTDRSLSNPASEAERVEALGHMLVQALSEVEKDLGQLGPGTRRAMAHHFWCELLVQLVVVIEESNHLLDSVPGMVTDRIVRSRQENGFAGVERKVIAACATQVWKRLIDALGLAVISDAKVLLPALRTLAVLMCKSPPRHPGLVEHCVDPLKAFFVEETKKRLKHVFEGLVPQITAEINGANPAARAEGSSGQPISSAGN